MHEVNRFQTLVRKIHDRLLEIIEIWALCRMGVKASLPLSTWLTMLQSKYFFVNEIDAGLCGKTSEPHISGSKFVYLKNIWSTIGNLQTIIAFCCWITHGTPKMEMYCRSLTWQWTLH